MESVVSGGKSITPPFFGTAETRTRRPEAVVMVMLGGQGTIAGPAIGAFLYEELRGWLLTSATFSNFQLVIAGAILLVIVTFAPGGVMGFIHRYLPKSRKFLQ